MSLLFWRKLEVPNPQDKPEIAVDENNALPVGLYWREDESLDAEPVTSAHALPVDIARSITVIPARRKVSVGFYATAAGDYAAADVMSNSATGDFGVANQLPNVVSVPGEVAILDKVVVRCSEDSVLNRLRLHFYNYFPLPADVEMDDNIAADWAKIAAGRNGYVTPVTLPAFADMGTAMAMATAPNLREELATGLNTKDLYFVVETLDAEANETAGMRLDFDFYFLN